MAKVTIKTSVSGPFFQSRGRVMREAKREWMRGMVKEGEAKYRAQLYPGHGVATGTYKSGIHGTIKSDTMGGIGNRGDKQTAIIGNWLESGNKKTGGRFKGYGAWRKTRMHLTRLTRELGGKVYKRATKRLT